MSLRYLLHISLAMVVVFVLSRAATTQTDVPGAQHMTGVGPSEKLQLPPPFATPSVRNTSKVIGWPKGRMPTAAPGFEVSLFAEDLDNPRQAYVLPNGDVLVVEATREWPDRPDRPDKSANRIALFRDTKKAGKPDDREVFLTGLNMPHGMLCSWAIGSTWATRTEWCATLTAPAKRASRGKARKSSTCLLADTTRAI